jgi:hypothetical protein
MNISQYTKLKSCGLIGIFGCLNKSESVVGGSLGQPLQKKINYEEKDLPMDIIMGQLTSPVDFKNIIILFTSYTYGTNRYFGGLRDGVLTDHCTYPLEVCSILKKHGIKFKDGRDIRDNKYSQRSYMMLIVQNGIAYPSIKFGDPTRQFAFSDKQEWSVDESDKITVDDKEIIMSGFFVHRFRK